MPISIAYGLNKFNLTRHLAKNLAQPGAKAFKQKYEMRGRPCWSYDKL